MTTETPRNETQIDAAPLPSTEPVHLLVARRAADHPGAIAAHFGGLRVTYRALGEHTRSIASGLRRLGIVKGSRVGVLLTHSIEAIVAILGVLEAGAAFVPLDPAHPPARTSFVARDAGLTLVITEPSLADHLDASIARSLVADLVATPPSDGATTVDPLDPAYVLYTSGSTGDPKGVVIPHRALTNYVTWAQAAYVDAEPPAFALYSSLAFDLTLTSLFVPLVAGGQVIVHRRDSALAALHAALDDDEVDTLKLTPSQLAVAITRERVGKRLRRLIVGGEALPTALAQKAVERFGSQLVIVNEYGPTEATVGCVAHTFDPQRDDRGTVPIGRPIANMRAYLLDAALAPLSEGETGEIYLAGEGLALGYLGDDQLTRARFVPNPGVPGETLYRTGDLGRLLPGGELEFVGRRDGQIKFNGHRVELDGLKSLLTRHPRVRDAAVVLREAEDGAHALVAYVVGDDTLSPSTLRQHLETIVPREIIPNHFIQLPALPLGPSGKVDSRALPGLDAIRRRATQDAPTLPRDPTEEKLASIWAGALGLDRVGVEDDFFELGGHSLLANRIILQIREVFGVDLNMRSIAESRTVAALAGKIAEARTVGEARVATEALPPIEAKDASPMPPPQAAPTPIRQSDEENLVLAESASAVDSLVGDFYSRFPWPWNSSKFEMPADPDFEITMINQELGDYDHALLPKDPSVWVAGCGTNQALLSALRFPRADVLGTDLSTKSLEICESNAAEIGAKNLTLRLESINDATYEEQFDFILCTGVIHHTYDPAAALARLARALKRDGVIELLVYNRFHRTITSAFQKAIRILTRAASSDDLAVAKRLAAGLAVDNRLAQFVGRHRDWEESDFADLLINPVEHSFTVDSLAAMADTCGLELVRPCISLYAKFRAETIDWEMRFDDPDLQRVYDALPDLDRWRVSNLLLHEKSPMLWFYLRRKDAGWRRKTERELADELLRTKFVRTGTQQKVFLRDPDGVFRASTKPVPYPAAAPDASVRPIYERFEEPRVMGDVLAELGIEPSFAAAYDARRKLTIPAFPYLKAVR